MLQVNSTVKSRVDVVIPVLNKAHVLEKSVAVVRKFLKENLSYPCNLDLR